MPDKHAGQSITLPRITRITRSKGLLLVLTVVTPALLVGGHVTAAAPSAAYPLSSPAAAPLTPPEEDELYDWLIEVLQFLCALIEAEAPDLAGLTAEQLMVKIQQRYQTHGVPSNLTPQERAQGRDAIEDMQWLIPQLQNRLDPGISASFSNTLPQIYTDLGG